MVFSVAIGVDDDVGVDDLPSLTAPRRLGEGLGTDHLEGGREGGRGGMEEGMEGGGGEWEGGHNVMCEG